MSLLSNVLLLISLVNATNEVHRVYETIRHSEETVGNAFNCLYQFDCNPLTASGFPYSKKENCFLLRFCRRPTSKVNDMIPSHDSSIIHKHKFTFGDLRKMNISAQNLFDWYAPMDTIEAYIDGEKDGEFYNCSQFDSGLWFGSNCQYTFDSEDRLADLIPVRNSFKVSYASDALQFTNGTCYQVIGSECQSILCLDWREICDDKTDCTNGLDEHRCHELEMNTCDNETEFRCRNGQCIDKGFYFDGEDDCIDLSDEPSTISHRKQCNAGFMPECEDRSCPPTWFSCFSGHCYDGPNLYERNGCQSQRDALYFQQMPSSTLVLFSHVSLIYNGSQPDWICYNELLCPHLSLLEYTESKWLLPNTVVCRKFTKFINQTYGTLINVISSFKSFVRSCSSPPKLLPPVKCSMFSCEDNDKCISNYRLSDGRNDCSNGEDERQNNTCSLNLTSRYQCDNGRRCIPYTQLNDRIVHCADRSDEYRAPIECSDLNVDSCSIFRDEPAQFDVDFDKICDGIHDSPPDRDNNTDETHCSMNEWKCDRGSNRCDSIWNCLDGHDEVECPFVRPLHRECNDNGTHFCFDIKTGAPMCLPPSRAGDGRIDCVGSADERSFCRDHYPNNPLRRFRCHNSDKCISPLEVCDCHHDCPFHDDETVACEWLNNGQKPLCHPDYFRCHDGYIVDCIAGSCRCMFRSYSCRNAEDLLFCELIDRTIFDEFSIDLLEEYPNVTNVKVASRSTISEGFIAWHCNQGLHVRSPNTSSVVHCLCPDYYYGDRCQYQRKRISLIIQPIITGSFSPFSVFKIVVLLVRQSNTIVSHDQFIYVPNLECHAKYITQLLYPIDESWSSSMNYSIHVHSFVAETLEHRQSFQWRVPFDFLPVVRMVKRITLSDSGIPTGVLIKPSYGGQCRRCANVSTCMGRDIDLGRDICVCPLNRTGHRCLITFNPCTEASCNGNGKCIATDERYHQTKQFRCICNEVWSGENCENPSARISVSFAEGIKMPSFKMALIHLIQPGTGPPHITYFHRLHENTSNFTVALTELSFVEGVIFIQLFENLNEFTLYLLAKRSRMWYDNHLWINISSVIHPSRRCRSVKELLNATTLNQPVLRRVKYFQEICLKQTGDRLYCFYDENLMCLCDTTNHTNCFNFESMSKKCLRNKCNNRGKCIQDHSKCPTNSICLCEPCSYGSVCQFTTVGYSVSLDVILGSHARYKQGLSDQTTVIKISVLIISLIVAIGTILNILTVGTFTSKKILQFASGRYLLVSSIFSMLTLIVLMLKIILLIHSDQKNLSCSLIEFLLKWLLSSSEWLNASVSIERALAIAYQTRYSNRRSKVRAKWVTIIVLISVGILSSPELVFRRVLFDRDDERVWCALTLNGDQKSLQRLYSASNLLLFVSPLIINFVASVKVIVGTFRLKEKTMLPGNNGLNNRTVGTIQVTENRRVSPQMGLRLRLMKDQIVKHKHILIAPALLGAFAICRLVMTINFVCTKVDQKPYLTLSIYLIGFFPSLGMVFAFILPSQNYRTACGAFLKAMIPRNIRDWFTNIYRNRQL